MASTRVDRGALMDENYLHPTIKIEVPHLSISICASIPIPSPIHNSIWFFYCGFTTFLKMLDCNIIRKLHCEHRSVPVLFLVTNPKIKITMINHQLSIWRIRWGTFKISIMIGYTIRSKSRRHAMHIAASSGQVGW